MSYYRHHVFFCTNRRENSNRPCCAEGDSEAARDYAKRRIKALGLNHPGGVRINQAGCMERCGEGPVMVIYPQGVWYTYASQQDLDEIIDRHLVAGEVVERLRLPDQAVT